MHKNPVSSEAGAGMSSRKLMMMSVISFFIYLSLSLILFQFFREGHLLLAFEHGRSVSEQLLAGIVSGAVAAGGVIYCSSRPPVSGVLEDFTIVRVIANTDFTPFDRIQLSVFAGIGEEMLFRGAIQPLLGIWITSFIFIAIHGYFIFRSIGHILFGVLLFGLSMMLGYLYEFAGLIAAMSAHTIYDILMLYWVRRSKGENFTNEPLP